MKKGENIMKNPKIERNTITINEYVNALSKNAKKSFFANCTLDEMKHFDSAVKKQFIRYLFCDSHTGKMFDIDSVSTNCKCNIFCREHAKVKGSICEFCYSDKQLDYQTTTNNKTAQAHIFFTNIKLTVNDIPVINSLFFRFEAFGDLQNELQFENYCTIAAKNPLVRSFTLFTKNPFIIRQYLDNGGIIPENIYIGYSALFINQSHEKSIEILEKSNCIEFIDFVFTVFDDEYINEHNIDITCGSRSCINCLRCYTLEHGKIIFTNERKK